MAVIFYSLSGEGMGHSTRSEVVIRHLLKKGHKIVIFTFDRAVNYLRERFKGEKDVLEIVEISGINFVYEKNEFKIGKTILEQRKKTKSLLIDNHKIITEKILEYSPMLVVTDFEPFSSSLANFLKIPLIAIDNQGFFSKCKIDEKFEKQLPLKIIEYFRRILGDYNFVLSIFNVPIKKKYKHNTFLIGPIIRDEIVKSNPRKGNHFLVYQTSTSNKKLFKILKSVDEKFIVYGFNKNKKEDNLILKKPSVKEFAKDLASCRGVITNGGFTLISEAVYLGKPVYSVPVKKQTEQEINGYYIMKSGYGMFSKETNLTDLKEFISHLKKYEKTLKNTEFKINDFDLLDNKIESLLRTTKEFKRKEVLSKLKKNYDKIQGKMSKFLPQKN